MIVMAWCLTGCSELRVIGAAAMRELHAEAIPVNWETTPPAERTIIAKRQPDKIVYSAKSKSFSSFRSAQIERKRPVKGLWEQHGG
jgi:hypothetical protein